MTHFAGLVLTNGSDIDEMLAPYQENDEWGADGTRYDWYAVGGRFTGLLDRYDPTTDERNYSPCEYCEATGVTTQAVADKYPAYQKGVGKPCIQCAVSSSGKPKPRPGMRLNFHNADHDGDVMPARNIDIEQLRYIPSVIITPDAAWHERARFGMFGVELKQEDGSLPQGQDEWAVEFCRILDDNRDCVAVLVDFHV
jgi:hypothetical protein